MNRVLITGGSRGIGLAIAHEFNRDANKVLVLSRNPSIVDFTHTIKCDVLEQDSMEKALKNVEKCWGNIDILINNVGGGGRWGEDKFPEDFEEWQQVYQKNAGAATQFTRAFLPHMRAQKWGRVITISSIYGKESGGNPWFTMAKAAEIALMKSLAIQRIPGVTFNTVCPGYINVEGKPTRSYAGTPEDVAHLVSFLASDKAKHINGACITVDGGESRSF